MNGERTYAQIARCDNKKLETRLQLGERKYMEMKLKLREQKKKIEEQKKQLKKSNVLLQTVNLNEDLRQIKQRYEYKFVGSGVEEETEFLKKLYIGVKGNPDVLNHIQSFFTFDTKIALLPLNDIPRIIDSLVYKRKITVPSQLTNTGIPTYKIITEGSVLDTMLETICGSLEYLKTIPKSMREENCLGYDSNNLKSFRPHCKKYNTYDLKKTQLEWILYTMIVFYPRRAYALLRIMFVLFNPTKQYKGRMRESTIPILVFKNNKYYNLNVSRYRFPARHFEDVYHSIAGNPGRL
jgi:hypothetical protein